MKDASSVNEELKSHFLEGLSAHGEALRTARNALLTRQEEAVESVRRIARSLHSLSSSHGFETIAEAAARLVAVPATEMEQQVDALLEMLQRVPASLSTPTVRILVLDDDPDIQLLLKKKLSGLNREVLVASTPEEAEKILVDEMISLIILDLILPGTDGRDLLLRFRALPTTRHIPIIVASAAEQNLTRPECLALGADDYFEKPFDPESLSSSVSAKLQRLADSPGEARLDPLTGLPDRASFCEIFYRSSALCTYIKENLSVALVDLDRFMSINEKYGRSTGDRTLRRTASVLACSIRKSDFLARWESDKFAALFPRTDCKNALHAVGKMAQSLDGKSFTGPGIDPFHISFSAGVVEVSPGVSAEDAVNEADRLVHLAKVCGGHCTFSARDRLRLIQKKILLAVSDPAAASTIRHCLEREGFEIFPIGPSISLPGEAAGASIGLIIADAAASPDEERERLEALKKWPTLTGVPMLAIGPEPEPADRLQRLSARPWARLSKPVSPFDLLAHVLRLLRSTLEA
ncbi:MAG: diguanylate cyclase [Planctomycetes bacterium]|nr:diguanylate cyclase [Planctomycetota bacterium]